MPLPVQWPEAVKKDAQGNTNILQKFWNTPATHPDETIVHPILVYADLIATGNQRNLETARILYDGKLLNLSGKIEQSIVDALLAFTSVLGSLQIRFFLVGAGARDLIFKYYGIKSSRKTEDVDLGIQIDSWEEFNLIRDDSWNLVSLQQELNTDSNSKNSLLISFRLVVWLIKMQK